MTPRKEWPELLEKAKTNGFTLRELGEIFGLSYERVRQILKREGVLLYHPPNPAKHSILCTSCGSKSKSHHPRKSIKPFICNECRKQRLFVSLVCPVCKKGFSKRQTEYNYVTKRGKRIFCSRKCLGKFAGTNYGFGNPETLEKVKDYFKNLEQRLNLRDGDKMTTLFQTGYFILHSGQRSNFKIDCDALSDEDIKSLANIISRKFVFRKVIGIPRGGLRLAKALEKFVDITSEIILIVDDVLTTGQSMEEARAEFSKEGNVWGVVIFARNRPPDWVVPIFRMGWIV